MKSQEWQDFCMVSMMIFQVLWRCFHVKLCKILLIKLCAPRGKFSKKDVGGPMGVDLSQLHGAGNSPVHMLVVFDLKVLQLGPLHSLVLQRFSSAFSPANQQENRRPATSAAAPSATSAAASSSHSRGIVCHKCQGRGHIAAECPSKRNMLVNEQGERESESDEDGAPIYDEEIGNDET
jgi:hypothetical protein